LRRLIATLTLAAFLGACPGLAVAAEAEVVGSGPELTLNAAITLALEHSRTIKKAELTVEKAEKSREQAETALTFTPILGQTYDAEVESAWYNLLTADLSWRMSKRQADQAEDALVLQVCQLYWNVQAATEGLELARVAAEQAERQARVARAAYQVGTVSSVDAAQAEQALEQAQIAVEQAERAVETAYLELNNALGLDVDVRPVPVDRPEFSPLEVVDLEQEVARVMATSPSVWLAEQQLTLQTYKQQMIYATGTYTSYELRKIEKQETELEVANTKDQVRQQVRKLYLAVRNLESSYRKALAERDQAAEGLRVARAKFEAGMATTTEVRAKELALAQAEASVNDLVRQHAYYKLLFQKPWAAGGA